MNENEQCEVKQSHNLPVEKPCSICGDMLTTTHINADVSHMRCAFNSMAAVRRAMQQAPYKFVDGVFVRDAKPHHPIAGECCGGLCK